MKITFTFTDSPDLSKLPKSDIYNTYFELPEEAQSLSNIKEQVLVVADLVGKLTEAVLHLTCKELGLQNYPVYLPDSSQDPYKLRHSWQICAFHFTRYSGYRFQYKHLSIIKPIHSPLAQTYFTTRGKRKREKRSLRHNLVPVRNWKKSNTSDQEYFDNIEALADLLLSLLNLEPADTQLKQWQCDGFNPYWTDGKLIDRYNRQSKKASDEARKRQKLEEKLKQRLASSENSSSPTPVKATGSGRRPGAVPGVFKGVQFRSQLEIRFATELESRGIRWVYESERLSEGNYLVDFYLPDLKTWVEVKGRFEPRDNYLLKEVAALLKQERDERLFVYTQSKCFAVHSTRFTEIKRSNFWDRLLDA